MNYNKREQPYEILDRFHLDKSEGLVEYCRVKFLSTKHEQIVRNEKVAKGDFEDASLVNKIKQKLNVVEPKPTIEDLPEGFPVDEELEPEPEQTVIAINPQGEEIVVEDLEVFCVQNELDPEAVQAVIEGKQKTHRKWRFKLS